ncbi:hypothetical protein BG452_02975 [Streptomyces sp. CBMA123]|nr:hypothetical protein [Streptomyces sp. CBMA123]
MARSFFFTTSTFVMSDQANRLRRPPRGGHRKLRDTGPNGGVGRRAEAEADRAGTRAHGVRQRPDASWRPAQ